jgi:hypothetical protein
MKTIVDSPIFRSPSKNSTCVMEPSKSMAVAAMRIGLPWANSAPSFGTVISRLAVVMPSSRMNTRAEACVGSMFTRWHGMPSGGSVSGGHSESVASTISMGSGLSSGLGMTSISTRFEPAGMLTSHGRNG